MIISTITWCFLNCPCPVTLETCTCCWLTSCFFQLMVKQHVQAYYWNSCFSKKCHMMTWLNQPPSPWAPIYCKPLWVQTDIMHHQPLSLTIHHQPVNLQVKDCLLMFAWCFKPQVWVVCAEIFPLRYRSRCVGLTTMWLSLLKEKPCMTSRVLFVMGI